jgi:hypothetical protein
VLLFRRGSQAGTVTLLALAFGLRHPPPGRTPSVYEIAHRRLERI